ncbi:MAG: S8 family serine peptidase [Thermomicrobiales bacterium]
MPGELIVRFDDDASEEARKDALATGKLTELQSFDEISAKLVRTDAEDLAAVIAELSLDSRVKYAEPNFLLSIDQAAQDPQYPYQWSLENTGQIIEGNAGTADADIDAPEAWNVTTGSPDVIVAVIDSGIDLSHPEFGGTGSGGPAIWTNPGELCPGCSTDGLDNDGNGYIDDWRGWDFVNLDGTPQDDNGHGSHVAGIIAARSNNAQGGTGIAYNSTIMALKAFGAGGGASAGASVGAVIYAANHGADIINASWGGIAPSISLEEAVVYAGQQGVLFIAAGGNDGLNTDLIGHFPSALDLNNLISVGATNNRDELSDFSNYGLKTVDLGAPGEDVYSVWVREDVTLPYRYASGTSMAAPHVAGVAALIKARFPNATPLGIKNLIFNSADRKPSLDGLVSTGARLNAANAVTCSGEPQVWIDRPVPGFAAVPGEQVDVRILASNCALPGGVSVSASAGDQAFDLIDQGGGLFTGTFIPDDAGEIRVSAQARLGDAVDSHEVTGEAVLNYRFQNDAFDWIDATGGTRIAFEDERDFEVTAPLPFPFTFYNRPFEEILIGENGLVGFGGTRVTNSANQEIPDIFAPNGFIAAFWDNLTLEDGGEIWYDTVGEAPNRRFVVSWIDIPNTVQTSGPTATGPFDGITFQIVLEESTNNILLQYLDVDFNLSSIDYGSGATIGVEHFSGTVGRQFSYNDDSLRDYEATTSIRLSLRNPAQPEILTRAMENAIAGQPYVQTLRADGGEAPIPGQSWTAVSRKASVSTPRPAPSEARPTIRAPSRSPPVSPTRMELPFPSSMSSMSQPATSGATRISPGSTPTAASNCPSSATIRRLSGTSHSPSNTSTRRLTGSRSRATATSPSPKDGLRASSTRISRIPATRMASLPHSGMTSARRMAGASG